MKTLQLDKIPISLNNLYSLIRVFEIQLLDFSGFYKQGRLRSACAYAQADQHLLCLNITLVAFSWVAVQILFTLCTGTGIRANELYTNMGIRVEGKDLVDIYDFV